MWIGLVGPGDTIEGHLLWADSLQVVLTAASPHTCPFLVLQLSDLPNKSAWELNFFSLYKLIKITSLRVLNVSILKIT